MTRSAYNGLGFFEVVREGVVLFVLYGSDGKKILFVRVFLFCVGTQIQTQVQIIGQ